MVSYLRWPSKELEEINYLMDCNPLEISLAFILFCIINSLHTLGGLLNVNIVNNIVMRFYFA